MGAGSRRGTILNIETRNSLGGYNSIFSYLESVWAGVILWGCFPYNSSRDYLGYNSILGAFSPAQPHILALTPTALEFGTSAQ